MQGIPGSHDGDPRWQFPAELGYPDYPDNPLGLDFTAADETIRGIVTAVSGLPAWALPVAGAAAAAVALLIVSPPIAGAMIGAVLAALPKILLDLALSLLSSTLGVVSLLATILIWGME